MARNRGFTWIELLIILAVVAIPGAMAIPGLHDPGGMEVGGHDDTDIPAKWLPLECRGAPKK